MDPKTTPGTGSRWSNLTIPFWRLGKAVLNAMPGNGVDTTENLNPLGSGLRILSEPHSTECGPRPTVVLPGIARQLGPSLCPDQPDYTILWEILVTGTKHFPTKLRSR